MEKNMICPLCGSKNINFFCKKNNHKLYNCLNCKLGFVWPVPKELEKVYSKEYFKKSGFSQNSFGYVDYEKDKNGENFEKYLDIIEELTAGREIFDWGAATGYFLDLARARGWKTSGIEISDYAAGLAREKGHNVFLTGSGNPKTRERYDAVTMWDVLEHLDSPKNYLKIINGILKKRGVLAINTIDRESFWAKFLGKNWHAVLPPEHLYYYSVRSLKILLGEAGFEILKIKKIGKKFSLAYIFKILYSWQGLKIWNKLSRYFNAGFWRKFALMVNLRDNIFIVARKVEEI